MCPTSRKIFTVLTCTGSKKGSVIGQTITHAYSYKCKVLQRTIQSFRQRNSKGTGGGCHPGVKLTVILVILRTDLPDSKYFPFSSFLGFNIYPC